MILHLRYHIPALAFLAVFNIVAPVSAQASFDWLNDAADPRGMALANASVAEARPMEALSLNPASLSGLAGTDSITRSLHIGLRRYPASINQQMIQAVLPVGVQVVAFEVRRLGYGSFVGYDIDRQRQAEYSAEDLLLRAGYMRRVGRYLRLGATLGVLSSRLADVSALAVLWSFGAQLNVAPVGLRLGAAVQSEGRFVTNYGDVMPDQLPTAWLVGLAKSLAYLPVTIYISTGRDMAMKQLFWRLGSEFKLSKRVFFRLGVDQGKTAYARGATYTDLLSGLSLGLGMQWGDGVGEKDKVRKYPPRFVLDGAIKLLGPLGVSSAIALGVRF
ncbi:MAG: hypothetical protein JSW54_09005 [Fidelibacterota bacterium]|nr:MAG: hypothetical protein JSW54_09005 [Candidatus Neomarinimicrobiota bacterium]